LNICGEEQLYSAIKKCFASFFNTRAIAYREAKGFGHLEAALSVGVMKMIRSDLASSGIMFTLDPETGFKNIVVINSIYGLGEMIVRGKITPDQFYIFKPTLKKGYASIIIRKLGRKIKKDVYQQGGGIKEIKTSEEEQKNFSLSDKEILILADWAVKLEEYYGMPQDIEWAKDGKTKQLFIVQSRPETIHSIKKQHIYEEYKIAVKQKPILNGIAIGNKISIGRVRIIKNVSKISQFQKGEILVTKMTDPDWVPAMRIANGIITEEGGSTCHAAIIARELGIPAIVGAQNATKILTDGKEVTIDCTQGKEGRIFANRIPFKVKKYNLEKIPLPKTKIMINIGAPDIAFKTSFLPNEGVGLARIEFIFAEKIKVHPLALYYYDKLKNQFVNREKKNKNQILKIINEIEKITIGYKNKKQYFIDKLAEGVAQIAGSFYPKPVIIRFSDFKTNEYRALVGGTLFEPEESNPMIGWRGASRYYDEKFKNAFEMECKAIKKARNIFGLKNIWVMVPFCRTPEEGKKVVEIIEQNGLKRGKDGLKIIVMCEIPSNVILAEKFLDIFDGMSIGSNDLTQLDRDSGKLSSIGNETNEAVKILIKKVIEICNKRKKYCGICGDAPSSYVEFAKFLIQNKISSISLSPDAVLKTILKLRDI